jgi:hypothetical protein
VSIAPPPNKDKKSFWGEPQAIATIVAAVIAATAAIVVALIKSDVIIVSAGPAIQPSSATTAPPSSSGPPPTPTPTPTPEPTSAVTVRRSTADYPLTLSGGYSADLDSMNSAWDVKYAATISRFDLSFNSVGLSGHSKSDLAVVSGPASYETCSNATAYSEGGVSRNEAKPGMKLCARTSEKRYAFITIKKLLPKDYPKEIQLDVTVWNPPFEE